MTIVFKVSDNIKPKIIKYYENLKRDKTPLSFADDYIINIA